MQKDTSEATARGSSGSRPVQEGVGDHEVGARRTRAWVDLFTAADVLVGLDCLEGEIETVLRVYLCDEWWRGEPFGAAATSRSG